MGLYPFSTYKQLLLDINHRSQGHTRHIVIYTDATIDNSNGVLCTRAVSELQSSIRKIPAYLDSDITVHYTSALHTYALLHSSRYLICSASTLCFFAGYGKNNTYIPKGKGLILGQPSYKHQLNVTFFDAKVLRPKTKGGGLHDRPTIEEMEAFIKILKFS